MTVFVSIAAFCGLIYFMTDDDLDARSLLYTSRNLVKIQMDGAAAAGNNNGVLLDNRGGIAQQPLYSYLSKKHWQVMMLKYYLRLEKIPSLLKL